MAIGTRKERRQFLPSHERRRVYAPRFLMNSMLIDHPFSRRIHAAAGIIISTVEDYYLTTADAMEAEHTNDKPWAKHFLA